MNTYHLRRAVAAACLCAPAAPLWAQSDATEQRLQELEQRIAQLESTPAPSAPASAGAFNPAVSLILSGTYANLSEDPAGYRISGFALPADAEAGPGTRGFSLAESELGIAANVDPDFFGSLALALAPDDTVSVEEAYIQTIGLSNGLGVKAGRFFSSIGYLNSQHAHTWDFVDAPLAYQALLGTQFGDDGVQVKWLAPTDLFLELGAEAGRGRSFPGSDTEKNGIGAGTFFVHAGDDVGASNSWRAGLSLLATAPREREVAEIDRTGADVTDSFSGDSRLWVADFIWKYAPNGNKGRGNFKVQAEYLQREEQGDLTYAGTTTADYASRQSGWYLQGVYQFAACWRAGLRTDRLDHGSVDYGANGANLKASTWDAFRNSVMVDYSPSEFSRIRLQYSEDQAQEEVTDHELFLQYQMSLGAHGAHPF
jgi:hypothetical protein